MMFVKVKSMAVGSPLDTLNESIGFSGDLFLICYESQVHVHIICSQSRERRPDSSMDIRVATTWFLLWTIRSLEMIDSFQSLVSFDGILQFKLNLGINWIKFEISFVNLLRCEAVMSPSELQFVSFVLAFILSSFEELAKFLFHHVWIALVHHLGIVGTLKVISDVCERLWCRCLTYLSHELISEGILLPGLIQEWTLRFHIENSKVIIIFNATRHRDHASLCQIFVCHILLRQQKMCVVLLIFFLLKLVVAHG
tara:strand:+ start:5106 stop:5867 length:762 start_codon:yes stop_codon:yes gene_type:complete